MNWVIYCYIMTLAAQWPSEREREREREREICAKTLRRPRRASGWAAFVRLRGANQSIGRSTSGAGHCYTCQLEIPNLSNFCLLFAVEFCAATTFVQLIFIICGRARGHSQAGAKFRAPLGISLSFENSLARIAQVARPVGPSSRASERGGAIKERNKSNVLTLKQQQSKVCEPQVSPLSQDARARAPHLRPHSNV